jgi:hypothetical protein
MMGVTVRRRESMSMQCTTMHRRAQVSQCLKDSMEEHHHHNHRQHPTTTIITIIATTTTTEV